MKQITLQINEEDILALKMTAGKGDLRKHLCSVFFEIRKKNALMVATDGHRLIVVHHEHQTELDLDDDEVIETMAPISLFDVVKAKRSVKPLQITFSVEPEPIDLNISKDRVSEIEIAVTTKTGTMSAKDAPVEGKYVNWRGAIPAETSGEPGHFNPKYIGDFGAMSSLYRKNDPVCFMQQNGESAAFVDIGAPHVFGIIMPVRRSAWPRSTGIPDWLNGKTPQSESDLV